MKYLFILLSLIAISITGMAQYYSLTVYNYSGQDNEAKLDQYFKDALVPALRRTGVKEVGVFKLAETDTSSVRKFITLVPLRSLAELDNIGKMLENDKAFQTAAESFRNAPYNESPFQRMERIVLKGFSKMPMAQKTSLTGDKKERVYELRSYESPTMTMHINKVKMFNDGDEVGIFKRLGFNAIFYGQVLSGSRMPNLMYMTAFENKASREAHWKAFGEDSQWNALKSDTKYDKNNVSHIDITFLYPAEYSDF